MLSVQNPRKTLPGHNYIYIYIYVYIYIYTRRKDGVKASSLLDRFGQFDVPTFDAKAQVFDPCFLLSDLDADAQIFDIQVPMLKPRLRPSMLKWFNPGNLIKFLDFN